MRLTQQQIDTINSTAHHVFGADVTVWLFGSRLNDQAKGGDIDLLIQLNKSTPDKAQLALRYNALLQMQLGMQKFDILVIDPTTQQLSIHQQALTNGVQL